MKNLEKIRTGSLYFGVTNTIYSDISSSIYNIPYDLIGIVLQSGNSTYVYLPGVDNETIEINRLLDDNNILHHSILEVNDQVDINLLAKLLKEESKKDFNINNKLSNIGVNYDLYQSQASVIYSILYRLSKAELKFETNNIQIIDNTISDYQGQLIGMNDYITIYQVNIPSFVNKFKQDYVKKDSKNTNLFKLYDREVDINVVLKGYSNSLVSIDKDDNSGFEVVNRALEILNGE